ncbi:hypothetical protein ACFTWS_15630 [Streptomyces sp. NPDC057027]|uniref:PspA-associated protein PspAB n=1 Tax=Streptomyces sp. NPDC057027 TaxID=3346004 RepID=UPI00362BFF47
MPSSVHPIERIGEQKSVRSSNVRELEVRGLLAGDLALEPDMERWFPVRGAPGLGGSDGQR